MFERLTFARLPARLAKFPILFAELKKPGSLFLMKVGMEMEFVGVLKLVKRKKKNVQREKYLHWRKKSSKWIVFDTIKNIPVYVTSNIPSTK
jgi:hypothetical protein